MPRAGQIIPAYTVPHVATYINDNSIFVDTADVNAADDAVRLLCIFASSKGEDGVVKPITSLNQYIEEYGNPNFNLYGQAGYMPYSALLSGQAKCYCMRVMPDTATYSNVLISALAKTEEITPQGGGTVTQMKVKFVADYDDSLTDRDSLHLALENLASDTPDADGYKKYPFLAFTSKGRGVYGNNFRVRVVPESSLNEENQFFNYLFQILENSNGTLMTKETFTGCINDEAIINNVTSLLIDDAINDPDDGSSKLIVTTIPDNLKKIYTLYKTAVTAAEDYDECNLLTGKTKSGLSMIQYVVDAGSIAFDVTTGISLDKGSDSTFAADYVPGEGENSREASITNMYVQAFSGELDPAVKSKRRVPCELILDAGYDQTVKSAMVELAVSRMDARLVLDAGILSSVAAAKSWAASPLVAAVDSFVVSKECSHLKIRDPFSGKVIPMTYTYILANKLPMHYKVIGNQIPMVGEDYSVLTDHLPNSVKPAIDADDMETKEYLYKNHVNFLECVAENKYIRGVQSTSQHISSDLSEENNVAVLLDMKRELENFVSKKIYKFAEAEDRKRFTEDADELLRPYNVTKVRSFEIRFDMNAFEEERSILHCYLAVTFKTMAKRGIIEIDINKRV